MLVSLSHLLVPEKVKMRFAEKGKLNLWVKVWSGGRRCLVESNWEKEKAEARTRAKIKTGVWVK